MIEVFVDHPFLKNSFLQIEYLTNSLRIMGLTPADKTNMLADIGDFPPIPTPYGDFHFRGGHRLWHAPESMPRTYIPDEGELKIAELPDGVSLETQTEPVTGIRKRIEIHLAKDKPFATLTHTLINDGLWPVELAPWAITQFRLGGTVILPMPVGNADPDGLLPNRQFALWPYARINDPRLKLDDEFILFKANALLPPFKIGYFNPQGWLAYWLDGVLFRKTFEVHSGLSHPDHNCNSEIYCNDQFVELESLAPLKLLPPGESVSHMETWDLTEGLDGLPEELRKQLLSL
jgi:hypothetical protein